MRIQTRNFHRQGKWKPLLSSGLVQTFHVIINLTKIKTSFLVRISAIINHQPDIYLQERAHPQLRLKETKDSHQVHTCTLQLFIHDQKAKGDSLEKHKFIRCTYPDRPRNFLSFLFGGAGCCFLTVFAHPHHFRSKNPPSGLWQLEHWHFTYYTTKLGSYHLQSTLALQTPH